MNNLIRTENCAKLYITTYCNTDSLNIKAIICLVCWYYLEDMNSGTQVDSLINADKSEVDFGADLPHGPKDKTV